MEQKYIIDKKRNRAKYCPCGKNNKNQKFAPFVGFETKGYCFSCDKTFFPEDNNLDFKQKRPFNYKAPTKVSFHEYNLVSKSGRNYKNNNFIQFVKSLFGEDATNKVIQKYLIGTSKLWHGANVFWQIDNDQKVRHGKIMLYNRKTGKRHKNILGKAYISSVRSVLKLKDYNLKQCLFGLHLINETNNKNIAIVESEKTAILMSIYKPEYIWLATGSKSGFKYEYLKPLKDYKIIGFPDKSEYNDWQNKSIELNNLGFNISVSKSLESTNYAKGTDLADILINEKLYTDTTLNKLKTTHKTAKAISTPTEIIVRKLAKTNPNIIELIKVFDLVDKNNNELNI